jgi:hypothetical protein
MGFFYAAMYGGVAGLAAAGVFIVVKHIIERNQLPMRVQGSFSNNGNNKNSNDSEYHFHDDNWEDNYSLREDSNKEDEEEEETDDHFNGQSSSLNKSRSTSNSWRLRSRLDGKRDDDFKRFNMSTKRREAPKNPIMSSDDVTTPGFTTSDGSEFEEDTVRLEDYKPQIPRSKFNQ